MEFAYCHLTTRKCNKENTEKYIYYGQLLRSSKYGMLRICWAVRRHFFIPDYFLINAVHFICEAIKYFLRSIPKHLYGIPLKKLQHQNIPVYCNMLTLLSILTPFQRW